MKRTLFVLFAVVSLVFGVGCSGTDNGGGGGGSGPAGMWILGTCYEESTDGGDVCQESWTGQGESIQSQLRDEAGNNCEDDPGDEWTRAEATCPSGSDYLGTCIYEAASSYTKNFYYAPNDAAGLESSCETGGGEWVVE